MGSVRAAWELHAGSYPEELRPQNDVRTQRECLYIRVRLIEIVKRRTRWLHAVGVCIWKK